MSDQSDSSQTDPVKSFLGTEVKRLGYSLFFRIPDNKLECRCSYVPNQQGAMITRDELKGFLAQYKVRLGIDQEMLDYFAVKAAAGIQQMDVLLASGTPPVTGADSYISLTIKPAVAAQEEEADTEVDMYAVQTFINVSSGEEIGRIIPPEPGITGRNIMGYIIPPQPGKPLNLKIGKNIRLDDDGATLIAEADGRFCQASGEISVEEEYVVKGDVNFRVGTINFKGVVDVRGDVLDNFDITASKGLRVSGNIGVSKIVSGGDIAFCGMDGQDKAQIICGGTLRAQFIHDTDVECDGDVFVEVEIHNCTIKSLGRIVVVKGAISGGSYIALGGIESKKIGSPASVRTKLSAGIDHRDVEELDSLFAALAENHTKASQTQTLSEIAELREERAALTDSIMAIRSKSNAMANAKVNAKTAIYDRVLLSIGTANEEIIDQKDGPLSVIENTIEGGLRYLPLSSLDVKADDIELAFVREHSNKMGGGGEDSVS
ncbi:MAG: FapA family protein [Desulfuromonadaceae bacterium]|nr:FapA family protein [Desulfuromonadaceae bacterium]